METGEVFTRLESRHEGLEPDEIRDRREKYGPNRLPPPRRLGPFKRFLLHFNNILIYVLLAAAGVTAGLGHFADTAVIIGVVVINALIGFVQEGKAEKALDAISGLLSQQATVLRGGRRQVISAEELVPGDVVLLQSGDKVPADLRLFRTRNLRIEEAALTGESLPVEKSTDPVAGEAPIGDRTGTAFSSTLVTFGQGSGVVVATGSTTEIGRINAMLSSVQALTTPLLRQIDQFGRTLTFWIAGLAFLTFGFGYLVRDYSAEEMFLAAVSLAVAAIPEGLPAIITITLAIGVQRMASRHAIIRRLPAVETLGSVSVICSDKTGTLTRNEMTAQSVATAEASYDITGIGYNPHGGFLQDGARLDSPERPLILQTCSNEEGPECQPLLLEVCRAALLCNDGNIRQHDEHWAVEGDPTEGALVVLALKAGYDRRLMNEEYPRTDVIPFESEHRFMATLHHDHAGHGFMIVKGAPERLMEMCAYERFAGDDRPLDTERWHARIEELASRGQRLLAIAFRTASAEQRSLDFHDVEGGLTLLGIVGLIDPPRQEAIDAVAACQSAGIHVKMITGDHALTAGAIGTEMGIGDGSRVMTGRDLDELDESALRSAVLETDVFARASPENKLRLVEAYQAEGLVVAMTGDGVNDAPALKRADVGVAMGINGTEVAKEAAEMVLTDDNFASIGRAVEEGRTVYDNIKKSVMFILPTNGGQALMILGAILMGAVLPITPLQILWVNMITAVTLALSLSFEPPESDTMRRPPRDSGERLLTPFLLWRIAFVSLILVSGTFGLFLWETRINGTPVIEARTIAVNTLVLFEVFYLFSTRYMFDSVLNIRGLFGSRYVLIAVVLVIGLQLLFTYAPFMQALFETAPVGTDAWSRLVAITFTVLLLVESEKFVIRRWRLSSSRRT
ncbi:cation-transporting P-type ATPase [Thiohalomonas denitrificans]|uniref:Potassium and/or sodium efflux P-type ATPase n=1 Tax=Thiohalomonas denitrificans TaxID=415747 RepID=A0A1G5Q1G7_9GAMM|nr:cation-transporting P-type ATPase [Thiohalomonas denitrificans]SCZ55704.1 potassium and/or sodium efflux P-type ATPase [Thiohalomonas denitrificans]